MAEALRIDRVGYAHPDAVRLMADVQAEYTVLYGNGDQTPLDPLMFEPPSGSFFVGYLDGVPVATGAWRAHSHVDVFGTTRTAEVKRMYVAPTVRGRGLARAVLAHLEQDAASYGARAMILETGLPQVGAIALYTSTGYVQIPPFGYYKDSELNRCYGRPLG